ISFDTVEKLPGRGRPLGIFADVLFQCYKFEFYKGDILFLYTDGLIEARNTNNDEFEVSGLQHTENVASDDND
ncbi:MAG: SpoIIE family protein phosphatase, partial [Leptonema sp. (in: Bacteria)]|nr:SpoIIE family protein phosphatase [Leptonema sp. (in: bacteria)]